MAKKQKSSFVSMLEGDKLVSQKNKEEKEEMTRLTLNIPIVLKKRMRYIANTMNINLTDLTIDAIIKHLDKLEKK